jgi:hypothetical protein
MVEKSMRELADVSLQLNSESNGINEAIVTLNNKLQKLNIGLEVWLDSPLIEPLPGDERQDGMGPFLGYCSVEEQWQLAIRAKPKPAAWGPVGSGVGGWVGDLPRTPLTKATREVRLAALPQLPFLVIKINQEAQRVLKAIQDAKALCSKPLTMSKNEILAYVLKELAARYEENNPRRPRSTFTPTTPEEEKPLREVLAELRAEGSVAEFVGTYEFTRAGYMKYRQQIEWIRTTGGL